ncbi:hypothetical protein VW29_02600 [Devosia limi DSM 17137]|uniref:Uncharacterized protein n=1 Tax=Devosia limi DSM 17137 TaxID=1121477 RepID=A0A0F5LVR5_9HYPH|nr:hypothetical protein [Devosia limi]KKB86465.1 hypothetical protein VW29_02600 [Devosia limi DSM 17137]SHE87948.1 hypothetical protein SAMN02745223_01302 [Devosia limi DSM 17137]
MTKVRFSKDFDFKPSDQATIGYKAGWTGTVTQACAKAGEAAGVGEIVEADPEPAKPVVSKPAKANG